MANSYLFRLNPNGGYTPVIASSATTTTNIAGGDAGDVVVQTAPNTTGFVPYTSASTSSTIIYRNSHQNASLNLICEKTNSNEPAGGTKNLGVGSAPRQRISGSGDTTVVLPNATTLMGGHYFEILNISTGTVTVTNFSGSTLFTVLPQQAVKVIATSVSTTDGTWINFYDFAPQKVLITNTTDNASYPLCFADSSTTQSNNVRAVSGVSVNPSTGIVTSTGLNLGQTTLSMYEEGSWTPSPTNLTVVGSPTYTGRYTRIGNMVFINLRVQSTTSTASTANSTTFTGLPVAPGRNSTVTAVISASVTSADVGLIDTGSSGTIYTPTWAASADVVISGFYRIN